MVVVCMCLGWVGGFEERAQIERGKNRTSKMEDCGGGI